MDPSVHLAQSVANPFIESSCIPDGSTGLGCFTLRQIGTITTGAGGSVGGIWLQPNPAALYYVDTANTGATNAVTGNWSQSSQITNLVALYRNYRVVSCGLRVEFIGNTQTDQGTIYLGQFGAGTTLSTFNAATPAAGAIVSQYFKRFPLRNGGIITWRPGTEVDQANFTDLTNATVAVGAVTPTPFIGVLMDGVAASSSAIGWEFVVNFEGQYEQQALQTGGGEMVRPTVPARAGWYETMKNIVDQVDPIVPFVGGMFDAVDRIARGRNPMGKGSRFNLQSLANGLPALGRLAQTLLV